MSSLPQNSLKPQRDVFLSRERRVDLAPAALAQLLFDVGDHFALFCVKNVLCKVLGRRHQKLLILLRSRIEGPRPNLLEVIGMVGIQEKRVEQDAHQALVATMRLHRVPNVVFQLLVGCLESGVHIDGKNALVVSRQIVRDIFER